jgi:deoxyadenosine/deoxycytidine kinase
MLTEFDPGYRNRTAEVKDYLSRNSRLIIVSGNIGLGKSTVTKGLGETLGIKGLFEDPEENPLLGKFLVDKPKYCFALQEEFLNLRTGLREKGLEQSSCKDRSFAEDPLVFFRKFFDDGYLTRTEYTELKGIFFDRIRSLPGADLLIALEGSADLAWSRIQKRAREMEMNGGWRHEDIVAFADLYSTFVTKVQAHELHIGPVLRVNCEGFEFEEQDHLEHLISEVARELID